MATAEDMLAAARGQLGQGEHPPGSNHNKFTSWYGLDGPWCDMFISWCADQVGATKVVGHFAYTPYHAQWFQDHGRWGQKPRVGAIVFYDWGGTHQIDAIDHVGIVEAVRADGSIVTIEGNTSDVVARRVRRFGIAGYGYPPYTSAPKPPAPKPSTAPKWPGRVLRQPPVMTGADVETWQQQMKDRGWHLAVDRAYGSESAGVAKAFQVEKGLKVPHLGQVDKVTWDAAWTAKVT